MKKKKHLITLSNRQDTILSDLSNNLGISLSEIIRRGLDVYIDNLIENGSIIQFTFTAGDKSSNMEWPKERFNQLYDYVKNNPNGALKLVENKK